MTYYEVIGPNIQQFFRHRMTAIKQACRLMDLYSGTDAEIRTVAHAGEIRRGA